MSVIRQYKTSARARERAKENARIRRRANGVPLKKTLEERFIEKIEIVTESGCWLWNGYIREGRHGQSSMNGRVVYAHRLSWELAYGPIPKGLVVCHKCDVPFCVNPNHLFIGTQADNIGDCVRKSRHTFGEKKYCAKLSADQVRRIRSDGRGPSAIADEFCISAPTVCDIKARRSWRHIPEHESMIDLMPVSET